MAEVYRARDTRLGRDIALKVVNESLAGSPELVRRFEQEARIAGSLNHPNLVAVYDFGLHDGAPYFITELLEGESLRQRLSRGRIPVKTALDWAAQMAHGLAAAHSHGIVHRDVKPDNAFISSDGHVKLLDFGIAKLAEAAGDGGPHGLMDITVTPTGGATRTGSVLGTPGYMAPEQVRGEAVDARTDIFGLGAVLYEMLCGHQAFSGATLVESGYAILHNDPEPLPSEVPPAVGQVVHRCLEKEPGHRFQSASDLAFALGLAWFPDDSEVLFTAGKLLRNTLVAVSLEGKSRQLYSSPSDIRLEDIAPDGSVLVTEQMERTDIGYIGGDRQEQTTLTWSNWTNFLAAISGDGKLLFSESVPVSAEEGQQPVWTFLRNTDGAPAQFLGDGAALDLSPDGRWALVSFGDRRVLSALPTGPGQPRRIETHGFEVGGGRGFRDGKRLLLTCRGPSEPDYRLCILKDDGSPPERISEAPLTARRVLHASSDGRWAATLDPSNTLLLISLKEGAAGRLPEAGPDAIPRGWSSEGHLWVTRGGDQTPARARLLRFDVERRRTLEERVIAPAETTGAIYIRDVAISPDGDGVAFTYGRTLGYLCILRGLIHPER
jgi:serine/threonine protein kinase